MCVCLRVYRCVSPLVCMCAHVYTVQWVLWKIFYFMLLHFLTSNKQIARFTLDWTIQLMPFECICVALNTMREFAKEPTNWKRHVIVSHVMKLTAWINKNSRSIRIYKGKRIFLMDCNQSNGIVFTSRQHLRYLNGWKTSWKS